MRVQSNFSGLIGTVTAAHIHAATPSPFIGNAGVATVTPTFKGFPIGVSNGTYEHTFDTSFLTSFNPAYITVYGSIAQAWADLQTAIVDGKSYFSIHTTYLPSGEIRGFLVPFTCTSVKSGNWTDPAVWTFNEIPTSLDKVIVSSGHIVLIPDNLVVNVKNIEINGELKCGIYSNLKLNQ
jgi:CHRD domain